MGEHAERPAIGEELAQFRARVHELQAAWVLPAEQRLQTLESALFELRYAAEVLLPRAAASGGGRSAAGAERREEQLLRAVYQGLPLPVVLLDREGAILRLNRAAAELVGVGAGYATGRPLAAFAAPGDRAGLRSQLAAAARGDGGRSRPVALLTGGRMQVTMVALRPPGEPHNAVLAVFQTPQAQTSALTPPQTPPQPPSLSHTPPQVPPDRMPAPEGPASEGPAPEGPASEGPAASEELDPVPAWATRAAVLLDVLDDAAATLLANRQAGPEQQLAAVAGVLRGRIADWVIADLVTAGGGLRRCAVAAPVGPEPAKLAAALETQDPASCPLAVAAAGGRTALQVRPADVAGFGRDAEGGAVIARAEVVSLVCLPVHDPSGGRPGAVRAVLTLFRSRGAGPTPYGTEPFSLPEAGVLQRVARHTALALGR